MNERYADTVTDSSRFSSLRFLALSSDCSALSLVFSFRARRWTSSELNHKEDDLVNEAEMRVLRIQPCVYMAVHPGGIGR